MAKRMGIPLENHLAGPVESQREASQPAHHSPDEAVIDGGLMKRRRFLGRRIRNWLGVLGGRVLRNGLGDGISDALPGMLHGVSIIDLTLRSMHDLRIIIDFRIPQESLAPFDQARGGEAFIGQDEKRGSR